MSMAEKTDRRSWTIPTTGEDNKATNQTRRNPTKKLNSSNSDVDSSYNDYDTSTGVLVEKRGNGGMAFELIMSDGNNKNSPVTKPSKPTRPLTSTNLARHRSMAERTDNTNSQQQQQKPNQSL
jgi:hypothetical protein